ncbi:hypothetical protein LB559_27185 [Mesorhizobium sp. BR1-1-3]|uniref:hypothetical protein n=1 Tax=Mesorhizobium sp. BR1-1-3 TaxID=2876651 RepID=UPI001CD17CEF|nr:hypothetical protein [Mesorhizobium sp. BR1-1-3]MBZ9891614.1 hypothetical protein [Mesorhizobium sp. BR1-1-3]
MTRPLNALGQFKPTTARSALGETILVAHQTPNLILSGRHFRLDCLCLLLLLCVSAGCSSSDEIEQQSRTAASAAQTASMLLDAWMGGAAPTAYTVDTLQSIGKTLADVGAQIRSAETSEPTEQASLTKAVNDLSVAVTRAEAGLQADDRLEVQDAQQDLRLASRSLAAAYAKYFAPKP